jgi:hypothetical protein
MSQCQLPLMPGQSDLAYLQLTKRLNPCPATLHEKVVQYDDHRNNQQQMNQATADIADQT